MKKKLYTSSIIIMFVLSCFVFCTYLLTAYDPFENIHFDINIHSNNNDERRGHQIEDFCHGGFLPVGVSNVVTIIVLVVNIILCFRLLFKTKDLLAPFLLFLIFVIGYSLFYFVGFSGFNETITYQKPILYLYPEEDMNVKVSFENDKSLLATYPKYINEWNYLVKEDGTIIDDNGRSYYALYWDENTKHKEKFETGFYVKSEDSIKFLEEKLFEIGLTDREANEFIMYWLPKMEENGDNLVHFELTKDREKLNKINIEPKPDSLLRISIEIKKVHKKVNIKEQKLEHFERSGFTAVEWGGSIY